MAFARPDHNSLLENGLQYAFATVDDAARFEDEIYEHVADALQLAGLDVGGDAERANERVEQHRLVDPEQYKFVPPTSFDPASLIGTLIGNGFLLALTKTEGGRSMLRGLNRAKYVRFTLQRQLRRQGKNANSKAKWIGLAADRLFHHAEDERDRRKAPERVVQAVDAALALCGGHPGDGIASATMTPEWEHTSRGVIEALRAVVSDDARDPSTLAIAPKYLRDLNAVRASYGKVPFDFPEGTLSIDNEFAGEPVCFTLRPDGEFDVDAPAPRIDPGMTSLDDLDVDDADGLDAAGSDDLRAPRPASPLPIQGRRSGRRSLPGIVAPGSDATPGRQPGDGPTPADPGTMGDVRNPDTRPGRARRAARRPDFNGRNGPSSLS